MERWQIIYLIILGAGFLIGWQMSPKIAVLFIWVSIIILEVLENWKDIKNY